MCALRPGVRGVSDRIRVRSIVGRFLEHSRIFQFANGGQEEVYLSCADWMPRNLYERVEFMFPLKDALNRERVRHEILDAYLVDNVNACILRKRWHLCPYLAGGRQAQAPRARWCSVRRTFCSDWLRANRLGSHARARRP